MAGMTISLVCALARLLLGVAERAFRVRWAALTAVTALVFLTFSSTPAAGQDAGRLLERLDAGDAGDAGPEDADVPFVEAGTMAVAPLPSAEAAALGPVDSGASPQLVEKPTAEAAPPPPPLDLAPGDVRVRDRVVLVLRAPRDGLSPQARARAATQRITALLAHVAEAGAVRADTRPGALGAEAVVLVGTTAVIALGPEDAELAGEPSLEAYAEVAANAVAEAFAAERTRSAVATTVFRLSLLVFTGLILFLLLTRTGAIATRLRIRFSADDHPVHDVSVGKVQVLSAGSVRVLLSAGVTFGYRTLQALLGFGYLLFGLSLFERTRPWTEQLSGVVLAPFSGIATRLASGMPMLVLMAIGLFALSVLLRFTGLFFDSVSRGETRVEWLPRELARPTSLVARGGIVVLAVVLISPLLTGDDDGIAAHAATIALGVLGLAMLPSLASAAFGAPLVFSRRLKKNEHVELGAYRGRVREVGLLELQLEDLHGAEVRIPHLYAFFHPLRILGGAPTIDVDIVVAADSNLAEVETKLLAAARKLTARADVVLISLDASGARYRVTSVAKSSDRGTLTAALAVALGESGIALGGTRPSP